MHNSEILINNVRKDRKEAKKFFDKLKNSDIIDISISLFPHIKKEIESIGDPLKEEEIKNTYISIYVYRINKLNDDSKILENIALVNNIYEYFKKMEKSLSLMLNSSDYVYSFQYKEKYYAKTLKDKILMLEIFEEEVIKEDPINFYQTMGSYIHEIKYVSPNKEIKKFKNPIRKGRKEYVFSKMSSSTPNKKSNNRLKREIKKNRNLSDRSELFNSTIIDLDKEEEEVTRARGTYIESSISAIDREKSNDILDSINKKREKIKYRRKTEKEIADWEYRRKRELLVFFESLSVEEIRLE